ncbi:prolyl oligopeptidase family serine peptidase [Flavobacteriaceae bacterium R38]|nr:prolyl oligopeptidase family serine peptidase [Flavobacteriaceae bacterium R38]
MKAFYYKLVLAFLVVIPIQLSAQELTKEDYQRAVSFMFNNYNNKTAFNLNTRVNWFDNDSGIWFIDYNKEGKTYKTVSFKNRRVQDLFDHEKLAAALNKIVEGGGVEANNLSLTNIERIKGGNLTFRINQKAYVLNLKTYTVVSKREEKKEESNLFESKSPDGKWIAFTKDYNLYIRSTESGEEHQLSFEGKKNYEYASWYGWYDKMEGENGERPRHFGVSWSEDSKWIATNICDLRGADKMYLLDWSIDSLYKPKLLSYYRGSPADKNMVRMQPVFFNVDDKKEIKTDLPKNTHINSVAVQWTKTPGVAIANYAERGFQKELVLKVDLNTNTTSPLITETSKTNIDNFNYWNIEALGKILFLSERSGWRQLYSFDMKSSKTTAITNGEYVINDVEYIDEKKGIIYFLASGKDKSMNPYHQQLYKTTLDGKVTLLTPEKLHHVVSFSDDGKYFSDNYSSIETPTKTALRTGSTGKILANLTTADVSEMTKKGWKTPQVFELTGKDGKTPIFGAIWKPTNFDPSKKYPIIDHTYTGPHTQMFPKTFDRGFMNQSLAELGFIVMMVDGLGTSGRSKEFHNHSYKNMGDNLRDHVLAINYLGKQFNWIDTNKVGIFGHSAGGFDTGHAMLAFPETYKVGVASSADHDFRMEKAWWPEMYMGWPVDESYHEVSNITMAGNLKGKLLLVHGGLDDNVNPSATFKLAEALVNADKQFDLLVLPSQRHGYQGKHRSYFTKKRWNYFVEHLGEKTPIWDFNWK